MQSLPVTLSLMIDPANHQAGHSQSRGGQRAKQALFAGIFPVIHEQVLILGPLAALTAIVFGSAVAIAFGLNAVLVIFLIIRGESEQISVELGHLWVYSLLFIALSAVSGAAMYSLMKGLAWQWRAQWAMWTALALMGVLVWLRY
jgi:peptidoglycan biosynthesis protein MviN/MurJ (putative lipid II flippase)